MIAKICATIAATAAAGIATAGIAAADTTNNIVNVGNDNLGASVGTNGGSVAVGGVRTSVNGIGTLSGTLQVKSPTFTSTVNQSYSLNGLETEWDLTNNRGVIGNDNLHVEGYIYPGNPWATLEATDTPAYGTVNAFELVCDPICHSTYGPA